MTLTKGLILVAIWYLAIITATRYWTRRQPPPPRHTNRMTATDWVTAMPTHPGTPPHGNPLERCQFRWQTFETFSDLDAEADDTHRCALYTIHTDDHLCLCGATHDTGHEPEQ